jgi:hypothetical protein
MIFKTGSNGTLSQTITDTIGQQYSLTYWVASTGATATLSVDWDGVQIQGSSLTNPNSGNAYVEYSFLVSGTGSDTLKFFENVPGFGALALDDVSLTSVAATPLPAALPLFASGLGALGFLGWRRKRTARSLAA